MRKKKLINCLSKKIFIKGVTTTLVALLPFSFIKSQEAKAIVGVDDALLVAGATVLTISGIGAYMGLKNSNLGSKLAASVSDELSDFGNSAKSIYNDLAFGYNVGQMLPSLLSAYREHLEGKESNTTTLEPSGDIYYYSSPGTIFEGTCISNYSLYYGLYHDKNVDTTSVVSRHVSLSSGQKVKLVLKYSYDASFNPDYPNLYILECYVDNIKQSNSYCYSSGKIRKFYIEIDKTKFSDFSYTGLVDVPLPPISDTSDYPTSISITKDKAEEYVGKYVEEYPEDNDNKPNYDVFIPFLFDLLEKDLGNGEITPQNLASDGIVSYTLPDNSTMGYYPYYVNDLPSNSTTTVEGSNINIDNNVNINNGSEVSDKEKNGILNILDNGIRKTTTMLNNLKSSMVGLGDTIRGLFDFLPEPVEYLFYSLICLSLVFSILSLRR